MTRLVLDTNVVIAGLLWNGPPHRLLECAIDATATLYSSPALVDELARALTYAKFNRRIAPEHHPRRAGLAIRCHVDPRFSALGYARDRERPR